MFLFLLLLHTVGLRLYIIARLQNGPTIAPTRACAKSILSLRWPRAKAPLNFSIECVFRRIVKYEHERLNARYPLVVCRFYTNGYSRSFITLSELTSQHRIWSYTVSCLQLIISFYRVSSFVAVERFASFAIG